MLAWRRLFGFAAGAAVFAALVGVLGCSLSGSGGFRITEPRNLSTGRPEPSSPDGVLRLLQRCYTHGDSATYRTLFTQDFQFVFGVLDPNGNAYRTNPWTRVDELASFDHLVNGGDLNQPPALDITLVLDRSFRATESPLEPGAAHKAIRTGVLIRITFADQSQRECTGFANFFFARGDSALIPDDPIQQEFGADSTRWYIQRWEDDTASEVGAHTLPTQRFTWGSLKALYRETANAWRRVTLARPMCYKRWPLRSRGFVRP
jgi:hypothetical protein